MKTSLSPSQLEARELLEYAVSLANIVVLWGRHGCGKSLVLADLYENLGGTMLTISDYAEAMAAETNPMRLEETFYEMVFGALETNDTVIVDDLDYLMNVVGSCNYHYARTNYVDTPVAALCEIAVRRNKRLIFGADQDVPGMITSRGYSFTIAKFTPDDFQCILENNLSSAEMKKLDVAKIHRFAPKLNGYQLRNACAWLKGDSQLDTNRFLEYLRSQSLGSNVALSEVQEVDLHDLKGIDDLIEALEAHIIVPLENTGLAEELDIKPKRGVLLAGPPGTGKTTVGRALAHRLKSKFFLIDGTIISGTQDFYQKVHHIFEAAKNNAPAIIFIDDSDVIFESGEEMGLYRYLLTMLDGLESESAGRVCVMMTAMDVGHLPPALVRSGRVELWLETRYPDEEARRSILETYSARLPAGLRDLDLTVLVDATQDLSGADLKRVIEDGKLLYAYDRARQREAADTTAYFLNAVETVRQNKERYAEAEQRARSQRPSRPPWFDMMQNAAAQAAFSAMDGDDE